MAEITRESNNVDKDREAWNAFIVKENELVTKLEETPLFGGGFGNIHKGIYGARFVAIKELKYQTESNNGRRKIAELCGTASGIAYLHVKNIVHGDVKGDNILISNTGEPCLADFGLSRQVEVELLSSPKNVTGRKGSLRWMAREILESDICTINQACDVWAFGMTMLELDTGVYPYAYLTDTAVYTAIVDGSLPRVPDDSETRIRRQDLVHNIREQCWQYPPKLRLSMDEILTRLETLAQEEKKLKVEHLREDAIKTLEPAKTVEYPLVDCEGRVPMHLAAKGGDAAMLLTLLQDGKDPNALDKSNRTPLHWAAVESQVMAVKTLLQYNANPNAIDQYGCTPLHWAAGAGCVGVITRLLDAGASVNQTDTSHCSPLCWAIVNRHVPAAEQLLEQGADPNSSAPDTKVALLHRAADGGDNAIVNMLLDSGAEIDAVDQNGASPLHYATRKDHQNTVGLLLDRGADVNLRERRKGETTDGTVLHIAVQQGNEELVKLLLENQADTNSFDNEEDCFTPLHIAACGGVPISTRFECSHQVGKLEVTIRGWHPPIEDKYDSIVKALLGHGARPQLGTGGKNVTPLGMAVFGRNVGVVRTLLENGGVMKEELETSWSAVMATICSDYPIVELLLQHGVNAKNTDSKSNGITALHIATALGETNLMQLLLQHSADPNCSHKNQGGSGMITPLYWAAITSEPSVRLLLEYGADPKTLNVQILHFVASNGTEEIMRLLLDGGAEPNVADKEGYTPLHWAAAGGHVDVANTLLTHGADADAIDGQRASPLYWAVRNNHIDVAETLLKNGASPHSLGIEASSPPKRVRTGGTSAGATSYARSSRQPPIEETPLHTAVAQGNIRMVTLLLKHRADPNKQDSNGNTALHRAAHYGREDALSALLSSGARKDVRNKEGRTPLDEANRREHAGAADMLRN